MNDATNIRKAYAFIAGFFLVLWPGLFFSFLSYKAASLFLFGFWPETPLQELLPFSAAIWAHGVSTGFIRELVLWLLSLDAMAILAAFALGSGLILVVFILSYRYAMREIDEELRRRAFGHLRTSRFMA